MSEDKVVTVLNKTEDFYNRICNADIFSLDIEANSTDIIDAWSVGMSVAMDSQEGYYIEDPEFLRHRLEDNNIPKIVHNGPYDRSVLKRRHGIEVDSIYDTMVAAHLLEKISLDRQTLTALELGFDTYSFSNLKHNGLYPGTMSYEQLAKFSCPHAVSEFMLWEKFKPELSRLGLNNLFYNVLMPLVPVISEMELEGVLIDVEYLEPLKIYFDSKMKVLSEKMDSLAGVTGTNYRSADQVANLFYDRLGISTEDISMTDSGKRYSVGAGDLLRRINDHPIIREYIQFKKYQQLESHFVTGLLKRLKPDGRLHTDLGITGTRTGRLNSRDPNLQNIPNRTEEGRRCRAAFIAKPGCVLVRPDYNQLELRLLAHFSQDPIMLEVYRSNGDLHFRTAAEVFGEERAYEELIRFIGKSMNFMIGYGGGEETVTSKVREFAGEVNAPIGTAHEWIKRYWKKYHVLQSWIKRTRQMAWDAGYVKTLLGRIRTIDEYQKAVKYREDGGVYINRHHLETGHREAVNTIIQGTAAEIVETGMVNTYAEIKDEPSKMLLQVHDELLLETPKDTVTDLARVLQKTLPYNELSIPFPIDIKVGPNWRDMVKLDPKELE